MYVAYILIGKLCGKNGDRVQTIKLRGEVSQGICYPVNRSGDNNFIVVDHPYGEVSNIPVTEGDDVTAILGITKYEPPIPVSLSGEVFSVNTELTINFDVENWKSYPDVFDIKNRESSVVFEYDDIDEENKGVFLEDEEDLPDSEYDAPEDEEVVITEKLHGTFTGLSILPYRDAQPEAFGEKKNILIFSKGLGSKGLVFKNNERNKNNVYVRSTAKLVSKIDELQRSDPTGPPQPIIILGETIGPGVQDLPYFKDICLRVFSVVSGYRVKKYHNWDAVEGELKEFFGYETVPVLYRGPFSEEIMKEHTDGKTALEADHIREGIVITPVVERYHPKLGRVCLKSVSDAYLTRKNGTEYN